MNKVLTALGFVPFFAQQLYDASSIESRLGRIIAVQRSVIKVACNDEFKESDWTIVS